MNQDHNQLGPSLIFIYFMIGFVIGVVSCMIILMLIRPLLPMDATWVQGLVFAPLLSGGLFGKRVASLGKKYQIPLGQALWFALGLSTPES